MVEVNMKNWFLLLLVMLTVTTVLSQNLEFSKPERLGSEINSADEELAPMLSPDGKTLYFSRAFHKQNKGGKYAGTDIWISRKDVNGNWTTAVNAGKPWNNKRSNVVVGISQDGSTVYLSNAYNNKSGIASSKYLNGKWTKPQFIPVPGINRDDFVGIYVHPSFEVMLISMKGKDTYGEEDLYVSLKDSLGNWSFPQNLGPTINTRGVEMSPFLSVSTEELFFSSNGHSGFGDVDILVSDREYGSWNIWSYPRNLGSEINSSDFESYLSMWNDTLACFPKRISGESVDIFLSSKSYLSNILPGGSVFLSEQELDKVYPKRISTILSFSKGSAKLTGDQQEVLWFISNRIINYDHVKVMMFVRTEDERRFTELRAAEMIKVFKLSGLEESRIYISTDRSKPKLEIKEGGQIEILLFK